MTREDAIKVLDMVEAHGLADEAKHIAIKALEQEPCEDCISRRAAISNIREMAEWHTGDAFNADRVIRHIMEVPSVTPKQTEITLESAIDYLNSIGWMQEHDRILTESAQSVTPKQRENTMMDAAIDEWRVEMDNAIKRALEKQIEVLDKIRSELHATAEMHEDGDYYLREEWIDEIIDKYKAESEAES